MSMLTKKIGGQVEMGWGKHLEKETCTWYDQGRHQLKKRLYGVTRGIQ